MNSDKKSISTNFYYVTSKLNFENKQLYLECYFNLTYRKLGMSSS